MARLHIGGFVRVRNLCTFAASKTLPPMTEPRYPASIREEELKNRVAKDFFADFDTARIIGDIDFCVSVPAEGKEIFEQESLLWAEAKKGNKFDIYASVVQLILTIGKARTFDRHLPPAFLGTFDTEKIAFVPYNAVLDVFYQNDFNWNVTPSDHDSKEFRQLYALVKDLLTQNMLLFRFGTDDKELTGFIKRNFIVGKAEVSKVRINKNNFTTIYSKWLAEVKPTISVNWEVAKRNGIIDADFYLADILSEHNVTLKQKLFVLLRGDHYELDRKLNEMGLFSSQEAQFTDRQQAHTRFWNRYSRPPKRDYWDYIVERRDLLVPQDVRERKGSFFTPQRWVELSQEYLARELGDDWQDEYYIWDCCAGTGNLLAGLTNKYRIYASTLDRQDVDVMHERIRNGANLLESHVFRFDFLNDEFDKLPQSLQDIIAAPEKRRKLVIYINPPYAEAGNKKQLTEGGTNKRGVSFDNQIYEKWHDKIGTAARELFAEFLIRVYTEIPGCVLAQFSTLKAFCAPNFSKFREVFRAELKSLFVVPANTFDNVKGQFPIGFFIWDTSQNRNSAAMSAIADVYNADGNLINQHTYISYDNSQLLLNWIRQYYDKNGEQIGFVRVNGQDVQNNMGMFLASSLTPNDIRAHFFFNVTKANVLPMCIYFAVRHSIEATWLNDRDQFLYPDDGWERDTEFQADCLVYALFHGQNRISGAICVPQMGITSARTQTAPNHWIPFTEEEVGAPDCFASHFMTDFMAGKFGDACVSQAKTPQQVDLFAPMETQNFASLQQPLSEHFSDAALDVLSAGREVWRYYMQETSASRRWDSPSASRRCDFPSARTQTTPARTQTAPFDVNASLYDIKAFFKGRDEKGRMNATSTDELFNALMENLRVALQELAKKIEIKVYAYGFLK